MQIESALIKLLNYWKKWIRHAERMQREIRQSEDKIETTW
jgi:hypothetical protein